MSLGDFNKSSAKIGHFLVKSTHGRLVGYKYPDKKTGKDVQVHKFECTLLGDDPSVYMTGFLKGSEKTAQEAQKKYKDGNVYKLAKTTLDSWTATAYISSPKAFRVDMGKSTLTLQEPSSEEAQRMPKEPVPPRTVAETASISTNKSQDLIAVVKEVKNQRQTAAGKDVIDVVLIDDSKTENGERATLFLSVWGDEKVQKVACNVGQTLAFFNLTVKMENGARVVNHYEEALIHDPPLCEKVTQLQAAAITLTAATDTAPVSSAKEWTPHATRDVSGPQPLCCTAFLDYTTEEPSANMPTIVQVPWLMIDEPARDDNVTINDNKGGDRLWLLPKGRDPSGSVRLGCPQRIAMELAQVSSKEEFLKKQAEDTLGYPLFVHARISRRVKIGSSQTDAEVDSKNLVSHTIEEIVPVSWTKTEAPNASFKSLLAILNNLPPHDECIQFAFLKDLQEDPHYGFKLVYDGVPGVTAAYAAVLVESRSATATTPCGDGFMAKTTDLQDVAALQMPYDTAASQADALLHNESNYTVVGYSGLNGIIRLDPPRGKKSRFAVLLIDKVENGVFEMQKAEYVESEDAAGAVLCFQRLRKLCMQIRPTGDSKRSHAESTAFLESPVSLKKCRSLKQMPTDCSLDADVSGHRST